MSKFDSRTTLRLRPDAVTAQGGAGFSRTPKMELLLLGVSNAVSEDTFYESGKKRDNRFQTLVHDVTKSDPTWVKNFVPWLRNSAQMRSASVVAACEFVAAGGEGGRQVIASACQRPDEPGEVLAYWRSAHGRKIPKPVKRGVADAVTRLYTESNALRYDGQSKSYRFGDVVELTHPAPVSTDQSTLFGHLIDRRHGREEEIPLALPVMRNDARLMAIPESERRAHLADAIATGWSWERLSGWLPGGMDAEAWEAVIPNMGAMALVRNLRNFDKVGISEKSVALVKSKLTDPEQIRRSRQFPIRFLSAWKAVKSLRWGDTLETALNLSLNNVPSLPGRTLILVDVSGSMQSTAIGSDSNYSYNPDSPQRWEVGGVFAAALGTRAEDADVYLFDTTPKAKLKLGTSDSILRTVESVKRFVGGGTNTLGSLLQAWEDGGGNYDRVILISDEQTGANGYWSYGTDYSAEVAKRVRVPVFTFNVAGYKFGHLPNEDNWITFGGLSDASFRVLDLGRSEAPWELG